MDRIRLPNFIGFRLRESTPLAGGRLFGGREIKQAMTLNGSAGMDRTLVTPGLDRRSPNSLMLTGLVDGDFSKHFVKAWSKLRRDGIRGVKVDYPATAWRPEGGFDDRYATTNSAYRRAFALLREAFGKDGLIDERNLGGSSRPCLDVTAGLVDTQRTWGDSNKYAPAMVSISGLRWYKNRTVFNYYPAWTDRRQADSGPLPSMTESNPAEFPNEPHHHLLPRTEIRLVAACEERPEGPGDPRM